MSVDFSRWSRRQVRMFSFIRVPNLRIVTSVLWQKESCNFNWSSGVLVGRFKIFLYTLHRLKMVLTWCLRSRRLILSLTLWHPWYTAENSPVLRSPSDRSLDEWPMQLKVVSKCFSSSWRKYCSHTRDQEQSPWLSAFFPDGDWTHYDLYVWYGVVNFLWYDLKHVLYEEYMWEE